METGTQDGKPRIITKDLLETIITSKEGRDNMVIKHFVIKSASSFGECFYSIPYFVLVKAEENGVEKYYDLFVKTPHENKFLRNLTVDDWNLFRRENMAYSEIVEDMIGCQSNPLMERFMPSVPTFYPNIRNNETPLICLENLKSKGYVLADKLAGLTLKECQIVMKEIAVFHALSFAVKHKEPENIKKYKYLIDDKFSRSMLIWKVQRLQMLVKKLESLSPDGKFTKYVDRLLACNFVDKIMESLEPTEPYNVICHGDLWCNNLLFKYQDSVAKDDPTDVKLVDFQYIRYALPTRDLAYFFYTSTTQTLRKKHLNDLLRLYRSEFLAVLKRLDIEFPEFTFEVLDDLFTKSVLFGVLIAFAILPGMCFSAEDLQFNGETNADLQQFLKHIFEDKMNMEIAVLVADRLTGVVEDAIEMGVL